MDILTKLGLDPELLDSVDLESLERVAREMKISPNSRTDPNQLLKSLRDSGIDIDRLIKKMRGNMQPKKSNRVGRNEKCPCDSGKKYKKCCWGKKQT